MLRVPSTVAVAAALVLASTGASALPPPGKGWTKKVPKSFATVVIPAGEECAVIPEPLPAGFEVVIKHAFTEPSREPFHRHALVVTVEGDVVTVCLAEGVELFDEPLTVPWKFGEPDEPAAP